MRNGGLGDNGTSVGDRLVKVRVMRLYRSERFSEGYELAAGDDGSGAKTHGVWRFGGLEGE